MYPGKVPNNLVATFSIVGFDPETEELGIAVQSKFIGVGSVVPWAKAGVGAVATQSFANTSYGPKGIGYMESGKSAEETIRLLTEEDEDRELRQVGIVDAKGNTATFTGKDCYDWAGGCTGKHYAAQGNILVNKETVDQMGVTYEGTEGTLAHRLLTALNAGQHAGGDSRGKQSAALLIVKEKGGYGGFNDRAIDLRVDDHKEPIKELIRIHDLHQLYFSRSREKNIVEIKGDVFHQLVVELERLGYLERSDEHSEDAVLDALRVLIHQENFEEREQKRGYIDLEILEFMKRAQ
ncbi:DUF1028 domain-containing protein [Pseudalkalibacillus salsuginis]|uniref:DUF1028 domain-containing protein n=1 Tax=Pseudalkalibacillus salsuginis TaxID=2910972 RepID=UPI001F3E9621|nr:DUF1028 domain-containing protein [Pseudalkalibacillus salsuginis]MCF6410956.1 DUF1028 domain-containing protein [Pseudalkalibacillus salsuginis]